jgi:hypothetical protein
VALNAGSAFVSLFAKFEKHDFEQYDRAILAASRKKEVKTALGGQFDPKAFTVYEAKLKESRRLAEQRSKFKAILGADFKPQAFNAYAKASKEAETNTKKLAASQANLTSHFKRAAGAAVAAAGAYVGLSQAKSAITVTETLAKTTIGLHKALGLSIKSSSEWAAQASARNIESTKLIQTFAILSKNVEAGATGFDKLHGKTQALQTQMAALGNSTADHTKRAQLQLQLTALLTKGAGAQADAFKRVGVSQAELKRGDFNEVLRKTADGLKNLHAGTEKTALMTRLFGRGWQAIVPLLRDGSKAMDEQLKLAEKYGVTFSGKTVKSVKELMAAQREAKFATMGLQIAFATQLAPSLTKVITSVARFVNQMREGTGAGGKFSDVMRGVGKYAQFTGKYLQGVWEIMKVGKDIVVALTDAVLSWASATLDGIHAIAQVGSHLPGIGGKFKDLAKWTATASDKINALRDQVKGTADPLLHMRAGASDLADAMQHELAGRSAHAAAVLTKNIHAARRSVTTDMRETAKATGASIDEINRAVSHELSALGSSIKIDASFSHRAPGAGHASGGWIGERGMVAPDMIHALLAPGEAVLNRHQQAIIEALLGQGFLDSLFARVQRPHYMAAGGIAGMNAAAQQLEHAHFPYQWGGGHQASPAPFGPMDCSGAVSYVLQHGGVNIPTMTSGSLMGAGMPGGGPVTVFANPVHTFMRLPGSGFFGTSGSNPGGGAGFFPPPDAGYLGRFTQRHFSPGDGVGSILTPTVTGTGPLAGIIRASLGLSARAANQFLQRQVSSSFGGGDAGDPGPGANAGNPSGVFSQALPLAGLPSSQSNIRSLTTLLNKENPAHSASIVNPIPVGPRHEHATGYMQMLPSTFRANMVRGHPNINSPLDNSASSINYQERTYGHLVTHSPYSMGGIVQRFASGGKAKHPKKKGHVVSSLVPEGANKGIARAIARGETGVVKWDAEITRLERRYDQKDREFGLSDEVLLIENDDGSTSVDSSAVTARMGELSTLASMREHIRKITIHYRDVVNTLIDNLRKQIRRLIDAINSSPGKGRAHRREGYRAQITTYQNRIDELKGIVSDLGFDIEDDRIDLVELGNEKAIVAGTTGRAANVSTDAGPADVSTVDSDTQAQQSQVLAQLGAVVAGARINAGALTAFASPGDIGSGGLNALAAAGGSITGAQVNTLATPQAAGFGDSVLASGQTINQYIQATYPPTPAMLRAIADDATSGIGLQASRSVSTVRLGI